MGRYRTIVADPPWSYGKWGKFAFQYRQSKEGGRANRPLPYSTMTVAEIAALPIADLALPDAHCYLWTTNRYLPDAFRVLTAWGFRYSQTLVWAKTPRGVGPGGMFAQNAEYVLVGVRGVLPAQRRIDSVWFNWTRTKRHSQKPEEFFDLVEQVSSGPYVELFARQHHRLGWDVWGNEVHSTVEVAK